MRLLGEHGLSFQAEESDVGALILALGRAGIGILALTPELATLEDLFFRLTERGAAGRAERPTLPGDAKTAPRAPRDGWCSAPMSSVAGSAPAAAGPSRAPGGPRRSPSTAGSCASSSPRSAPTSGFALAMLLPLDLRRRRKHPPARRPRRDNIFAAQITQSGLATPVLMLLFLSVFMLPLIASLVAGDIVANEDGNGTLKTILTRSVDRGQVFAAKALAAMTYAIARGLPLSGRRDRRRRRLLGLQQHHHLLGHRRIGPQGPAAGRSPPTPAS